MNKNIVIGLVVALIIIVAGFLFLNKQTTNEELLPSTQTSQNTQEPVVTGSVDDAVNAIFSEVTAENTLPTDIDPSLYAENEAALTGLGQSLDTTQF